MAPTTLVGVDDVLTVPQGRFVLRRAHHDPGQPLRAWDAADEYALAHLHDEGVEGGSWLVANDSSGALAVALSARRPVSWSDSCVSMAATAANLERNGIDASAVDLLPSTDVPAGTVDVAVVKVPRTLAFLEDELRRLRPHLHPGSVVVGAGMTKAVHRSTIAAFESTIGSTPTTRARKKSRLLLARLDPDLEPAPSPFPVRWSTEEGIAVTAWPNAFSATGLDGGTRLLLAHLPAPAPGSTVVDLGCGTGVVAATVAHRHPDVDLVCCDESHQAIASARATVGAVTDRASFHVTDVLDGIDDATADLVLLNPPFHAGGARTTSVAHRMFAEARRVLRPDGELLVVANRHLGHHVTLRRWFADVAVVASDPRFVVLRARAAHR
ncbi:MAG TPA: methyltransferase [Acidimicrobiales bacterium]|nr:methyltransferase [Acidimicrobiales bacterium]